MTLEQIDALGSELTGFLRLFEQCFHAGNVSHLRQYTRGTAETTCLMDILCYHQQLNAAALQSHRKRPRRLRRFAAL